MSKEVQKKGIKRERDEIINENIYDPRLITQESMDVSSSQIDKKIKTEKKVKIEKVKTENCQNVETSTERERRLTLARNCLEEISEKTGCSVKIVLHALWVNSGNLQDALDYLTTDGNL
jgi:ferric iron reductase protein FhuF